MARPKKQAVIQESEVLSSVESIVQEATQEITLPKHKLSNLEENLTILEELERLIHKHEDQRFMQLIFNYMTADDCITMGDLFLMPNDDVLKFIKDRKNKRPKNEVRYG